MSVRGIILSVVLFSGLAIMFFSAAMKGTDSEKTKTIVGLDAPELVLKDATGNTHNPVELKGSVLFVNFWASWCQPCRDEMPSIQGLYNHLKDNKQFRVITILYKDDYKKAVSYMKENNFQIPVFIDSEGRTARSYGISGIPETYIIDKKGTLRKKVIGPADWNSIQAISYLSGLIQE